MRRYITVKPFAVYLQGEISTPQRAMLQRSRAPFGVVVKILNFTSGHSM